MTLKELIHYIGWVVLAILVLALSAILGYWGPWYFAWAVGTVMTILLSAFAGALYDRQANESERQEGETQEP